MEEAELKVGFIGLEVGGRRKKGILDRESIRYRSLKRRMSLAFLRGREWVSQPVWSVEREYAGRKLA